jgi:hypothetical protein
VLKNAIIARLLAGSLHTRSVAWLISRRDR